MSHTEPDRYVLLSMNASLTNVPSLRKTWMRSFTRSHTYTKPSFETMTQCTVLNCFDGTAAGLYGGSLTSSGLLPYAPQCRLYLPVSASKTMTRRFPYPSEIYTSFAAGSSKIFVGCQKFSVSLLPLWTPC